MRVIGLFNLTLIFVAGCSDWPDYDYTMDPEPCAAVRQQGVGCDTDAAQGPEDSADAGREIPGDMDPVVLLVAGNNTSGALTARGRALAWGRDVQLPYATSTYEPRPRRVELLTGLPPAVEFTIGARFCLLDTQGQVYCRSPLGFVGDLQTFTRVDLPAAALHLGAGTTAIALVEPGDEVRELFPYEPSPPVFMPETVSMLCSGGNFDVALGQNKVVYEWGDTQRQSHDLAYLFGPRAIADLPAARQIACGFDHACSLGEQGQVFCWGQGTGGQLGYEVSCGDPYGHCGFEPAQIELGGDSSSVVRIAASGNRSAALSEAGNLYLWGGFRYDGCSGKMACSHSPVLAPLPGAALEVALGDDHVCVLLEDGRVFCWGDNTYGQAQPADLSGRAVSQPVQVLP